MKSCKFSITELPHKSTLKHNSPSTPKTWLESTNQLELRPQWRHFEEESLAITTVQLTLKDARVPLFLDALEASQRRASKLTPFSINV